MWSPKKSIILSKICTAVAAAFVVFLLATAPWQVNWLLQFTHNAKPVYYGLFLATLYSGGALALLLLWQLFLLLHSIGRDEVFTKRNEKLLHNISWCCFGGAIISVASGIYYVPWFFVAAAAAFVGLIVRIVKNVIAKAVLLKEENDLTV